MAFNPDGDAEETAREDKGWMNDVVDENLTTVILSSIIATGLCDTGEG